MKVKDKVIVVTGGGNGIGRQLVLELLRKEARVAAIDINEVFLKETKLLAGPLQARLSTHALNIADLEAVQACAEEILGAQGQVDGIINCAGIIQPFIRLNDLPYEAIRRTMDVNFYGTLHVVKTFLPHLLQRPEAHIANFSSMGGFFPFPGQTVYGASKAAVKLLSEGLYTELKDTNVQVTVVIPGGVATNIIENSGSKPRQDSAEVSQKVKLLSPLKAAQLVIEGMEKNRYLLYVGFDSKLMKILYKLFPKASVAAFSKLTSKHLLDRDS